MRFLLDLTVPFTTYLTGWLMSLSNAKIPILSAL